MSTVLIIPEKNEGTRPLHVIEQGLQSGRVEAVLIVDGWSTDRTFTALQEELPKLRARYPQAQIEMIRSELRETGKGGAMVTGMKYALAHGFRNVVFLDGDIVSVTPRWIPLLLENMKRHRASMARGYFDRSTLDAQITRHVTRPLMAIYFPEGRQVQQPLGGEIALTTELVAHLLQEAPIAPPHHWGIDTFLTVNAVTGGFPVVEVYLTQKVHKKKSLTELRAMLVECFDELCKEIVFHGRFHAVPKPQENLVIVTPKETTERVGGDARSLRYVDLEEQRERFFTFVRGIRRPKTRLRELGLDHEECDLILSLFDRRCFQKASVKLNGQLWVSLIDRLARGYIEREFSPGYHDVIFACWQVRALAFAYHEAASFEAGEEATDRQAELAFAYGARYRASRLPEKV